MRTLVIDRSKFAEADDGDTTHYGGELTLIVIDHTSLWEKIRFWLKHKKWLKDSRREFGYCCRGSDRSGLDAWRYDGEGDKRLKYTFNEEFLQELGDPEALYEDINIRVR